MESNNIISAPQITDFAGLYKDWTVNHTGSQRDFLLFMTTPSPEREEFLASLGDRVEIHNTGSVAEMVIAKALVKPLQPGTDAPVVITPMS